MTVTLSPLGLAGPKPPRCYRVVCDEARVGLLVLDAPARWHLLAAPNLGLPPIAGPWPDLAEAPLGMLALFVAAGRARKDRG